MGLVLDMDKVVTAKSSGSVSFGSLKIGDTGYFGSWMRIF